MKFGSRGGLLARMAAQGRWLVPDPAGLAAVDLTNPQTWNRYAYANNNPLGNVDPFGLSCKAVGGHQREAARLEGCNMPGLTGGGTDVSIDGGPAVSTYFTGSPIDVGSIPTYSWIYGYHPLPPNGVNLGVWTSMPDGSSRMYNLGDTGWYWGQVGNAFGLLSSGTSAGGASADVAVGFDIWHCAGCADTWRNASGAANTALVATGAVVAAPIAVSSAPSVAPYAAAALRTAPTLGFSLYLNPKTWDAV